MINVSIIIANCYSIFIIIDFHIFLEVVRRRNLQGAKYLVTVLLCFFCFVLFVFVFLFLFFVFVLFLFLFVLFVLFFFAVVVGF